MLYSFVHKMYNLGLTTKLLLLTILLVSIPVVIIFSSTTTTRLQTNSKTHSNSLHIHHHVRIAHPSACDHTLYPELCVSTLASVPDHASKSISDLVIATLNKTMYEVRASSYNCSKIQHKSRNLDQHGRVALNDCLELLDGTLSELKSAISNLELEKSALSEKHYHRLQTLLSGAMTNQYTCLDGFAYSKEKGVRNAIKKRLRKISRHVSNSLVMLKKIPGVKSSASDPHPHGHQYGDDMKHGFPTWLTSKDRKLLQAPLNQTKPDLIVAKDGTGNFTTISAAVDAAPNSSVTRFVIYIKAGAYFENVEVEKKKKMLMFLGDGIGKTVVKANRSVVDGWTTFRSATVAVVGNGFIAKGITFENSAGPSKHQAVALRVGADLSAFYQCSFVAYQDTLYVHSLRQFFRECDVYGTVDFIFGNAAVVFQNCNLYARKPDPNQKNIFTAQGREDPNQNTGISIINCKVAAAADFIPVKSSFKTYLGRPWKEYSRTVFIQSNIEDVVDPAGWLEWNGTFALSTLYYGEYKNRGLGSNTTRRVTWPGYRVINSSTEASKFTVGTFIQGNEWLNATAVNGAGFLAKGITIENTAGPNKGQAVAFRSNSDFSAFYQCSFLAFQDTLYTHSYRQFYRECDVFGTVDFIFGNAAVVFQNCNLFARRPNKHQYNTLTAQGRNYKHENTGISIINCTITAADDLVPVKSKIKTYLGRPWRKYSRTVILNSYIDDLVEPDGWSKWNGSFALKTLYYGEYNNRGPGSDTSSRVTWPGYRVIREPSQARKFTVGSLIHGDEWLNSTGIPYFLDLE